MVCPPLHTVCYWYFTLMRIQLCWIVLRLSECSTLPPDKMITSTVDDQQNFVPFGCAAAFTALDGSLRFACRLTFRPVTKAIRFSSRMSFQSSYQMLPNRLIFDRESACWLGRWQIMPSTGTNGTDTSYQEVLSKFLHLRWVWQIQFKLQMFNFKTNHL